MHSYRTIEEIDDRVETLYEIQKSKFITHLRHVDTEEEAREFITAIKKRYFDARHNCSAYVLGEKADKQKSNDDGEPGAGGLIRAYPHAAALGIEAATTLEMTPFAQLDVAVSYEHLATIEHYMRQNEIRSKEADYAEGVTLHLLIPPAESEKISEDITNLTAGRAQIKSGDEELIAIPVK